MDIKKPEIFDYSEQQNHEIHENNSVYIKYLSQYDYENNIHKLKTNSTESLDKGKYSDEDKTVQKNERISQIEYGSKVLFLHTYLNPIEKKYQAGTYVINRDTGKKDGETTKVYDKAFEILQELANKTGIPVSYIFETEYKKMLLWAIQHPLLAPYFKNGKIRILLGEEGRRKIINIDDLLKQKNEIEDHKFEVSFYVIFSPKNQ